MRKIAQEELAPIENASRPGILAGLSLAALQLGATMGTTVKDTLIIATFLYVLCSLSFFSFAFLPDSPSTNRGKQLDKLLWLTTSLSFVSALLLTFASVVLLAVEFA